MPGTCVIGLQWGDEAKGKLVDLLTPNFDIVCRFLGGSNAGHTVVTGDTTYKLHLIPSGILNTETTNVIAPGVVLNPGTIIDELNGLNAQGLTTDNLLISERVHVVFPWHIAEDKLLNAKKIKGESIGTTLRGIGPCYRDKVGRSFAIRLGDMYRDDFADRVRSIVEAKNAILIGIGGDDSEPLEAEAIIAEYSGYAEKLKSYVDDTTHFMLDAVDEGKSILFEGAQGALLDIDHGTFPFVTSSNSSGVGVSGGSGIPARHINKVIGVIKAYSTRVGGGPFPTEQDNEDGQRLRELGNEYGTTTGRPRRCGWFDAVAVRYTSRLSGATALSLMMMDVISKIPEVKICVAYELDGERITNFPCDADDLRRVKPVYETYAGWDTDLTNATSYDEFPQAAKDYVARIAELIGVPVEVVSVGPDRAQTIVLTDGVKSLAGLNS
ncbi:MAG: adenylosuccinate synthase [Pirellulaceae bacterium]|nr:adenylosuccinate synthase [Pirellulaceae bacterium]